MFVFKCTYLNSRQRSKSVGNCDFLLHEIFVSTRRQYAAGGIVYQVHPGEQEQRAAKRGYFPTYLLSKVCKCLSHHRQCTHNKPLAGVLTVGCRIHGRLRRYQAALTGCDGLSFSSTVVGREHNYFVRSGKYY